MGWFATGNDKVKIDVARQKPYARNVVFNFVVSGRDITYTIRCTSIDNQRNGLETQDKASMLLTRNP